MIQSLAEHRLLKEFHYLSTVSGGGFIGGWLTRCLSAMAEKEGAADIDRLQEALAGRREQPFQPLENLRRYTNYLTPEPGLASADTWAGVLLWIRNTAVNWTVFVPTIVAVAAIPIAFLAAFGGLLRLGERAYPAVFALAATLLLGLGLSLYFSLIALPSHSQPDPRSQNPKRFKLAWAAPAIHAWIVGPTAVWCLLVPLLVAPLLTSPARQAQMSSVFVARAPEKPVGRPPGTPHKPAPRHGLNINQVRDPDEAWNGAIALSVAAWLVAVLAYEAARSRVVNGVRYDDEKNGDAHRRAFGSDRPRWILASFASSGLLFAALHAATRVGGLTFVVTGPLWILGTELARWTCFLALRVSALRGELDREWLARLNGTTLVVVASASAVAAATIALPLSLAPSTAFGSSLATGLLAALVGKSAGLPFDPARIVGFVRNYTSLAASLAALVFAALLLAFFGGQVARLAGSVVVVREGGPTAVSCSKAAAVAASVGFAAAMAATLLGRSVDLEAFSMHGVYRNRLTRAFLGTARQSRPQQQGQEASRWADLYTGFDADDDVRVSRTFRGRSMPRLFPVINVALNATKMSDSARAERMAVPFTITPTSCGSAALHLTAADLEARAPPRGAYIETASFDGRERQTGPDDREDGITLGRALAISGAAVSPNMGYHSSPFVAFVMTLFNVRLGAWMPNPGGGLSWTDKDNLPDGRKANETRMLLSELMGRSKVDSDYVYLSDGGHFDNLGLYEMLRRQCKLIVVVDAARDEAYGFQDLGLTLRRALIDMGVEVDFAKTIDVGNKTAPMRGGFARVIYDRAEARSGLVLYLKSWMPEAAPIEVRAFAAEKRNFPHDSTSNQFFTESDFESYRRLGQYLADEIVRTAADGVSGLTLTQLFELLGKAPAAR